MRDINLEVKEGDILGIIGRNGAGKSTLLKLLSRVTAPTKGQIKVKGRIASLLEVGTGFHPELTGRENIFMNGAILGMSKQEIKSKLDEIIDFSGVEKFIDTPVKRYSSGMYVRLAFAVAAHLEPEILVIDEVLAVGDAEFQKKCLGKMGEVSRTGRTVLFVSHNMIAIESLCRAGILLNQGKNVYYGITKEVIEYYLDESKTNRLHPSERNDRSGLGNIRIIDFYVTNSEGEKNLFFPVGASLSFVFEYMAVKKINNFRVVIGVYDSMKMPITRFDTEVAGWNIVDLPQNGKIICSVPFLNIAPGKYSVNIAFFSKNEMEDYIANITFFEILSTDYFGTGKFFDSKLSKVIFRHNWSLLK